MLTPAPGAPARQGRRRLRRRPVSPWARRRSPPTRTSTAGPSTIRNELAVLEELGLLAHPHTSAGRVPTDAGYRYFVDRLLPSATLDGGRAARGRAVARAPRGRRGDARDDRDAVAGHEPAGDRLRAADRARRRSATSRSSPLQPQVLMVVIITSTGGVSKRVFTFEPAGRPGPRRVGGRRTSTSSSSAWAWARGCCTRGSTDPTLPPTERAFLAQLAPAFTELAETAEDTLYVDGAARLLSRAPLPGPLPAQRADGDARAPRVRCSACSPRRSAERDLYVRIGARERRRRRCRSLSLVAANYGLPQRNLGTVSVIGPTRMDYARAIASVREAALQLSRFVEDVYERVLMPRDYYEVARRRPERRRRRDQEGVPAARARAAPGRQRARPRGRGEVQGGRRGLRGALRRRAPAALRRLRARGPARAAATRRTSRASARSPTCSRRSSARGGFDAAFGGGGGAARRGGAMQGGDVVVAASIDLAEAAHGKTVEVAYEAAAAAPGLEDDADVVVPDLAQPAVDRERLVRRRRVLHVDADEVPALVRRPRRSSRGCGGRRQVEPRARPRSA